MDAFMNTFLATRNTFMKANALIKVSRVRKWGSKCVHKGIHLTRVLYCG